MKKTAIKIFSLFIVMIIGILTSAVCAHSHETYFYNAFIDYNNISLMRNNEQIYLIGTSGESVLIEGIYPNESSISLSLTHDVHKYSLCSDVLIMVSFLDDNNNTKVTLYDISNDSFDSFFINSDFKYMTSHFAYSDGCVYVATPDGVIDCYSRAGKYYGEITLNTNICSLMTDFNQNVYALTKSGMYSITRNSYSKISNTKFSTQGCFISDDIFVDDSGNFYRLNESGKLLEYHSDCIYPCGGVYTNFLITSSNNKLFAINRNTGEKILYYSLQDDILQLYSIDNKITVMTYSESAPKISFVEFDEFKKIPTENAQTNNQNDFDDEVKSYITSDIYNIDFDNMKITHIPYGTTVAQFKKNMGYDGYKIEFYRYEKDTPLKNGNVGTATQAIFYNNNERYVFELSVIGDLTGEGNVNSRDKKQIFGQVVGRIEMTGVFLDSADLDESNEIDVIDIVLLLKMIKAQQ